MGRARTEAVAALRDQFTADAVELDVEPYSRGVESLQRSTVLVRLDRVTHAPEVPLAARAYVFALIVVTPLSDPTGPADDDLDDALEDTLHALDKHPRFTWEQAVRGVFESTQTPCYEITASNYTEPDPTTEGA